MDYACIFWAIQDGGTQGLCLKIYKVRNYLCLHFAVYLLNEIRTDMSLHGNTSKKPIERLPCEIQLQIL